VVIGVTNNGSSSGASVQPILDLDGAKIADKLRNFVGSNFDDFEVHEVRREGRRAAAIVVGASEQAPLVFQQQGAYRTAQGKPKVAFARGAVYCRHGAKSEPTTTEDLRTFIDRRISSVRSEWLDGLRRVIAAPEGTEIVAIQRTSDEAGIPTRIRITTDDDAPVYGRIDPDDTHPYRQTELIEEVNKRLPRSTGVNSWDIQAIRRVHDVHPETRPDFAHQGKYDLAPQYSEEFADWLMQQFQKDQTFFTKTRNDYAALLRDER
jgi:hypothetical protein